MRVFAVESLKKMTASDTRLEAIRNADPETLPSRLPLKEELEFNAKHKDKTTVVWVGMLPTTNSLDEKTKMASSKGYSVSSARNIETIKTNPNAMRVVFSRGRAIAVYYALISQDPQTKLCNGIMTSLDSVFFFPEFRDDDATSVQKRKDTWGAKVREACDRSDNVKRGTKRMHDETEFVVEDQRSVSAGMIVDQSYEKSGDIPYVEEVARAAEQHISLIAGDDKGHLEESKRRKVVKREADSE